MDLTQVGEAVGKVRDRSECKLVTWTQALFPDLDRLLEESLRLLVESELFVGVGDHEHESCLNQRLVVELLDSVGAKIENLPYRHFRKVACAGVRGTKRRLVGAILRH